MKIVRVKNPTNTVIKAEYFVDNTTVDVYPNETVDVGIYDVTKARIYRSMIKRGLQVKFVNVPNNYVFALKCMDIEDVKSYVPTITDSTECIVDSVSVDDNTEYTITTDVDCNTIVDDIVISDNISDNVVIGDIVTVTDSIKTEQVTEYNVQEQLYAEAEAEQVVEDVQIEEKPKRGRKKKVEVETENVEANE